MMDEKKKAAVDLIRSYDGPKLRFMEVCGTHTHEIFRLGIRKLLPDNIELISGPGCPVCVTPVSYIDEAVMLAKEHNVTICTFGDLVRVPGSDSSLAKVRAEGGRVQVVYSPLDSVAYAADHPDEEVCFLAVGFETTTPAACLAVKKAEEEGIGNFSILTATKTMPQAYQALRGSADVFLYPGHVSAITGTKLYDELAETGVSGIVAGFTANELIAGLAVAVKKSREGKPFFVNCYPRVVSEKGSPAAVRMMEEFMEACDSEWRGLGVIPSSGMKLRAEHAAYDARLKFKLPEIKGKPNPACRCGEVLQGKCKPGDCPMFGKGCTPQHPVGACMVSGEGACSAYYLYGGSENGK